MQLEWVREQDYRRTVIFLVLESDEDFCRVRPCWNRGLVDGLDYAVKRYGEGCSTLNPARRDIIIRFFGVGSDLT